MAHAYTPGLRVAERTVIRKERILPIQGEVLVEQGQAVRAEDLVARTELPGKVHSVNVINFLGITAEEVSNFMLKQAGDPVTKGEPLAETRPWLPFLKTTVASPVTGLVETVSDVTGQVILRLPPRRLDLPAYLDGVIEEVRPREGVVVRTVGAFIQGIFGIGGETTGSLVMAVDSPGAELKPEAVRPEHRGKILVGGSHAGAAVFQAAREHGVAGIVVGAIHDRDLKDILGYDLGVAITGSERVGFTLVVTEGFGRVPMARRTFELLASRAGSRASINGATQIRAGVLRPEIIVPEPDPSRSDEAGDEAERGAIKIGDVIRVIRAPWFGALAKVKELPHDPRPIETEATVRILVAELADGQVVTVPRANVELIEE